jgi:hypothetical protein
LVAQFVPTVILVVLLDSVVGEVDIEIVHFICVEIEGIGGGS